MKRVLAALMAGAVFGVGLVVAQMVNPEKVLAFLDVAGDWDPSLALVMGGGAGVAVLAFPVVLRRGRPLLDTRFHLPAPRHVDTPLLAGAAIFGMGWGLAGYCPGPVLVALSFGTPEPWWFAGALVAGSLAGKWVQELFTART
jgi:uncharacterized protein